MWVARTTALKLNSSRGKASNPAPQAGRTSQVRSGVNYSPVVVSGQCARNCTVGRGDRTCGLASRDDRGDLFVRRHSRRFDNVTQYVSHYNYAIREYAAASRHPQIEDLAASGQNGRVARAGRCDCRYRPESKTTQHTRLAGFRCPSQRDHRGSRSIRIRLAN